MIKEDLSVPTAAEFTETLNRGDHLKLIRDWADVVFHTVFVRKHPGLELPALHSVEGHQSFMASPDANAILRALDDFAIPDGADVFIKSEPLRELARNAYMLGAWLTWPGAGIVMNRSLMELLGMNALIPVRGGQERLYQAQVYSVQGESREGRSADVRSQAWKVSGVSVETGLTLTDEFLVYDDGKFLLFDVDGGAVPAPRLRMRSQLDSDEKVLFDTWDRPVYDFEALTRGEEDAVDDPAHDTYVPYPSLLDEALLKSFRELERAVNNEIMPDSSRLQLEVSKDEVFAEVEAPGADCLDRVEGRKFWIVFEDHPDWCLWLGGGGLALTDYSDEVWLPGSTGRHEVPEPLRLKVVRAIAWTLFWKGREPGTRVSLFPGQFGGLRPFRPDNLDRIFHPSLEDTRFPVLASMPCSTKQVPVLVHGEVPEGYVIEVLEQLKVPASDLPRGIPRRDSLLLNGAVHFCSMCGPIVIPKAAVEFPDEWYTGIRTSNTQLISDFKTYLGGSSQGKPAPDKDPDSPGAVIGICLGVIALVLMFVLVL
ncbi:hypothetical protein [Marinobacter daepoensis]|uniref:hypothetical protein n=1 Tax=Marinobacter daepoensis TaxID=262077 RepID=UPI000418BFE4|nr:hypothetical protein [Marinobacter daepoensis]